MFSKTPFHVKYPTPGLHAYKGICLPGEPFCNKEEEFKKIREFQVRSDDIAIMSYLRTGSRWTAERVSWICSGCDEDLIASDSNIERVVNIEFTLPENTLDILASLPSTKPRVYSSHLSRDRAPAEIEKARIIIPIRNPKDNVVSFYHLYQMVKCLGTYKGPWDDFLQGYMDGSLVWGSYFDWLKSWWPLRHQENVMFIKYEDSKRDPVKMVRRIAEFLGKTLSEDQVQLIVEKTGFSAMKNSSKTNFSRDPVYTEALAFFDQEVAQTTEFIRKGEVGDWKNYFTVKQNEEFNELIKEKLAGMELEFEYEL